MQCNHFLPSFPAHSTHKQRHYVVINAVLTASVNLVSVFILVLVFVSFYRSFINFYRATAGNAMHGIAVGILSVRLSVCPSVRQMRVL